MEKFSVTIGNTGETFCCAQGQSVLRAMEVLGRKGIPVGCRGGGCGVCKVRITSGSFNTRRMSRACVSLAEEEAGVVLACRVYAEGDLTLDVVGRMEVALLTGAVSASPTPAGCADEVDPHVSE